MNEHINKEQLNQQNQKIMTWKEQLDQQVKEKQRQKEEEKRKMKIEEEKYEAKVRQELEQERQSLLKEQQKQKRKQQYLQQSEDNMFAHAQETKQVPSEPEETIMALATPQQTPIQNIQPEIIQQPIHSTVTPVVDHNKDQMLQLVREENKELREQMTKNQEMITKLLQQFDDKKTPAGPSANKKPVRNQSSRQPARKTSSRGTEPSARKKSTNKPPSQDLHQVKNTRKNIKDNVSEELLKKRQGYNAAQEHKQRMEIINNNKMERIKEQNAKAQKKLEDMEKKIKEAREKKSKNIMKKQQEKHKPIAQEEEDAKEEEPEEMLLKHHQNQHQQMIRDSIHSQLQLQNQQYHIQQQHQQYEQHKQQYEQQALEHQQLLIQHQSSSDNKVTPRILKNTQFMADEQEAEMKHYSEDLLKMDKINQLMGAGAGIFKYNGTPQQSIELRTKSHFMAMAEGAAGLMNDSGLEQSHKNIELKTKSEFMPYVASQEDQVSEEENEFIGAQNNKKSNYSLMKEVFAIKKK